MQPETLYIVVPCYNEEEVLPETTKRLTVKMNALIRAGLVTEKSRILYVDDGSKDRTWQLIEEFGKTEPLVIGAKLSRNRGHQNALLAGLMLARKRADMTISMDADLQDDIEAVDAFLREYYAGHDIVYGVRSSRAVDSAFKRITGQGFYKVMRLLGVEIVTDHAEYRLMSRRALDALNQYSESNLFLRGIVPTLGYPCAIVPYVRAERFAGETKYPLKKMLTFAWEGITSFSVKPLSAVLWLGCGVFAASVIALIVCLCTGAGLLGCSLWMLGGVQLICTGLLGEYIGKIYAEVKHRPRYFIEKTTEDSGDLVKSPES